MTFSLHDCQEHLSGNEMDRLDNVLERGERAFLELFTTEKRFPCVILFSDVPR